MEAKLIGLPFVANVVSAPAFRFACAPLNVEVPKL